MATLTENIELFKKIVEANNLNKTEIQKVMLGIVASESVQNNKDSGTITFVKFFSNNNADWVSLKQYLGIEGKQTNSEEKITEVGILRLMVDGLLLLDVPFAELGARELTCEGSNALIKLVSHNLTVSKAKDNKDIVECESILKKFSLTRQLDYKVIIDRFKELYLLQHNKLCSFVNSYSESLGKKTLCLPRYIRTDIVKYINGQDTTMQFLREDDFAEFLEKKKISSTKDYIRYLDDYYITCYIQNMIDNLSNFYLKSKHLFCSCCMAMLKDMSFEDAIGCNTKNSFGIYINENVKNAKVLNDYFNQLFDFNAINGYTVEYNVEQLDKLFATIEKYRRLL